MDTKTVLPKDAVGITRCALCDNYLSVPPVFGLCEEGKLYRCGRCKDVECQTYARNFSYENVAKHMVFPCSHEKCKEEIPWGQVEDHEKVCPYKMVSCPRYWKCNKTVQISELERHFQEHPQFIFYENFDSFLRINYSYAFLLVVNEQRLFIYTCIATNSPSYVSVFSLSPSSLRRSTRYNLKLSSVKSSSYISYPNQNIVTFDERQHCLKCMKKGGCRVKYHPFSECYSRKGENIRFITTSLKKITSILDLLENPDSVRVTIDLVQEKGISQ